MSGPLWDLAARYHSITHETVDTALANIFSRQEGFYSSMSGFIQTNQAD